MHVLAMSICEIAGRAPLGTARAALITCVAFEDSAHAVWRAGRRTRQSGVREGGKYSWEDAQR